MRISWSQIRHEVRSAPAIKLVVKLWKQWRVRSGKSGLDDLASIARQASAHSGSSQPGKPLQSHKVSKHQPAASSAITNPSPIKMGLTYSEEAFDMECATQYFPTEHIQEVSNALKTLRQSCMEGTDRKNLLQQLHVLEQKAWLFQKDARDMTTDERYLAVADKRGVRVIRDTLLNRARHGIRSSKAANYQLDLKSIRLDAVKKIHTLIGHATRAVSPIKLLISLEKLEDRFARQTDYSNDRFTEDLQALRLKILSLKSQCSALLESDDVRLKQIGQKWVNDCENLDSRLLGNLSLSKDRPKPYRRKPRG